MDVKVRSGMSEDAKLRPRMNKDIWKLIGGASKYAEADCGNETVISWGSNSDFSVFV